MAHPRYAVTSARQNFSLSRTLFGLSILALAVLLCLPALIRSGDNRLAAAPGGPPPVPASRPATPAVAANPGPAPTAQFEAAAIRPSIIHTAVAAVPVADGLVGPAGDIGALGIPTMVLRAYHLAADQLAIEQPTCKLPWWLLAGIGHTESGHAESGRLTADGTTRGLILGPRLNGGIAGDAVIHDTDHGAFDGDTSYDRAVGPMQFIPSNWLRWGADGNYDGKKNPSNTYDATLAAAHYLCAGGRDLSTPAGLAAAVLSYNQSQPYLATVLAWGTAYRDGALALADSPLPVVVDVTKVRPPISARPPKAASSQPATPTSSSARPSPSSTAPTCAPSTPAPISTGASATGSVSGSGSAGRADSAQASGATGSAAAESLASGQSASGASTLTQTAASASSGTASSGTASPSTSASPSGCGR
ncbi:MAG: lytic transglycosylase domain-containing protein [Jatrophihabitans sp.]